MANLDTLVDELSKLTVLEAADLANECIQISHFSISWA